MVIYTHNFFQGFLQNRVKNFRKISEHDNDVVLLQNHIEYKSRLSKTMDFEYGQRLNSWTLSQVGLINRIIISKYCE